MNVCLLIVLAMVHMVFAVPNQPKDWWETALVYQIYPRSFADSDGDGIGDIAGITTRLSYLAETGVKAIWLSPIYESPLADNGYDISNFRAIHYEYGTMDDFYDMLAEAGRLGLKVILDLVPNHTSEQAEWFQRSVARDPEYDDYYIWTDGVLDRFGVPVPPNNWCAVFGGSAWTWQPDRGQFYFHQFIKEQPDLNYRNPRVVEEMEDVMRFWLEKGVSGFRVDAVNFLYEVQDLSADEAKTGTETDPELYTYYHNWNTANLPESAEMVYRWRRLLDQWTDEHGGDARILMTEVYANITSVMRYYGSDDEREPGAQVPFNFQLIGDMDDQMDAHDLLFTLNKWFSYMPISKTANWVLGNHDVHRVGTRYGAERIDSMNILLLTLPGVAITYYGEEIGMVNNNDISFEQSNDPRALNSNPEQYMKVSRDPERTPFQWNSDFNAGFSTAPTTWLPVNHNYVTLNLEAQQSSDRSHYQLYRRLAHLRQNPSFQHGTFHPLALNKYVLAYTRELEHEDDTFVVVINMGGHPQVVNLGAFPRLPGTLMVVAASSNSKYNIGSKVSITALSLNTFEAVVLASGHPDAVRKRQAATARPAVRTSERIARLLAQAVAIGTAAFLAARYVQFHGQIGYTKV